MLVASAGLGVLKVCQIREDKYSSAPPVDSWTPTSVRFGWFYFLSHPALLHFSPSDHVFVCVYVCRLSLDIYCIIILAGFDVNDPLTKCQSHRDSVFVTYSSPKKDTIWTRLWRAVGHLVIELHYSLDDIEVLVRKHNTTPCNFYESSVLPTIAGWW